MNQWKTVVAAIAAWIATGAGMTDKGEQTEIVQNECADFYPAKDLNNLIEQLYNHMEFDCLYNSNENNLFLTGVPIVTTTMHMTYEDVRAKIREKTVDPASEFVIIQSEYRLSRSNTSISIAATPKMEFNEYSIFYNRKFPENLPTPDSVESIVPFFLVTSISSNHKYKNIHHGNWGDYHQNTIYIWKKNSSEMRIISGANPGGEEFFIKSF